MTSDRELYLLGATKPPRPGGAAGHQQSAIEGIPGGGADPAPQQGYADTGALNYAKGVVDELQPVLGSIRARNPLGLSSPQREDPYRDLTSTEIERVYQSLQTRGLVSDEARSAYDAYRAARSGTPGAQ